MTQAANIKIEMLSTGDEVLYGQIVDTNSAWLSDFLFQHGFPITSRTTAGDNLEQLVMMLKERSIHNDILIVNGGLGPTSDDLSALAAAMANNEELVMHDAWLHEMEHYYTSRGRVMPVSNRKQAMLPKSAEIMSNPVGTACGFIMQFNQCILFFTPGVPSEFKVMVRDEIVPRMSQQYPDVVSPLCYRLTTLGRSESDIASELEKNLVLPDDITLGYRCAMPIIELKLTGPSSRKAEMDALWLQLKNDVKDNTIYEGTLGLPTLIADLLRDQALTLTVYEQYTSGLLSYQLYQAEAPLSYSIVNQTADIDLKTAAKQQLLESESDIGLAIGHYDDDTNVFTFALVTLDSSSCYRIKYTGRKYNRATQQDIFATIAMDILRRYLLAMPLIGSNLWLEVAEVD